MLDLSSFLQRYDIDCYKDEEGNYYIENDDYMNYLYGNFIKCEDMEDIINALPEGLLTDDLLDIKEDLGTEFVYEIENKLDLALNSSTAETSLDWLKKAEEIYPDDYNIKYQIEMMDAWANANLNDDIKDTSLTVAIIKAIENNTITLDFSDNKPMANIGDISIIFNQHKAVSFEDLKNQMDNVSEKNVYTSNDYDDYDINEAAKDISRKLNDMSLFDEPNDAIKCLETIKSSLSDFYAEIIDAYIDRAKENNLYIEDEIER